MSDQVSVEVPIAIEQLVEALSGLEVMFGARGRLALQDLQGRFRGAMAARDRGDPTAACEFLADAMARIATLADELDPAEAGLMRTLSEGFRSALRCRDEAGAKRLADVMFERSGARVRGS